MNPVDPAIRIVPNPAIVSVSIPDLFIPTDPLRELPADSQDALQALMNVQESLDQLEEIILSSPRLLGWRTLIQEDILLERLDQIRLSLPSAFEEAETLLKHREYILQEASRYAREIVSNAEQRARQLLDESSLTRQARAEAQQLLLQTQQEREQIRRQTRLEAEQMQQEAHRYVDRVLEDLEARLMESLQVIRNGRQQLR